MTQIVIGHETDRNRRSPIRFITRKDLIMASTQPPNASKQASQKQPPQHQAQQPGMQANDA